MMTLRDAPETSAVLSAGKALAIVEVLLQAPGPLSAREIGARCDINRTTAHRLLNTLIHHGWAERHADGGYRLSVKFLALAHVSTQVRSFLDEIRPALARLSQLSRETVHVGVLDGFDIVHVDKIESLEHVGVSSRIGARGVAHCTSLGKALLAASQDEFVAAYIAQAQQRMKPYRVESVESIWADIARTRERGYSLDDEEDSIGVRCLGAAVRGAGGQPLFAISLTGPSPRFTRAVCDQLAPTLVAVTGQLSRRFGAEPCDLDDQETGRGTHDEV
jgi:DNA-binding IclR family transcriptional regulator